LKTEKLIDLRLSDSLLYRVKRSFDVLLISFSKKYTKVFPLENL